MKLGDMVSVIDEDLEGIVTSIIDDIVFFQDKFGFVHRYSQKEIVVKDKSLYHRMKMEIKTESTKKNNSKKHAKKHLVLDLHFDKLVDNPNEYSGFERLFIQKKKLLDTLDFCRENNLKILEIVHGIGDGTVQKMVNQILNEQMNLEFHNTEILHHQSGNIMVYLL
jgi:DNA-nicking Smr family endonuclease